MSGKGDKQIKSQVPWKQYSDNWDRVFGDKKALSPAQIREEFDMVLDDKLLFYHFKKSR